MTLNTMVLSGQAGRTFGLMKRTTNARSTTEILNAFGTVCDGSDTWWVTILGTASADDMMTLAASLNSDDANVYSRGKVFWQAVQSTSARSTYGTILADANRRSSFLWLVAAIGHLLYSSSRVDGFVSLMRGLQNDIFVAEVQDGWTGNSTVENGRIYVGGS